jgi:PAT family beta-lactamase induction signal transducer AmpG
MFKAFGSRKMGAIMLLGFSSGLPLYLTSRTLQAWMTVAGVNLTAIGFFSLVSLPYSAKFLWSPLIDRFCLPLLGRRKGWLLATQLALAGAIAAMAWSRPAGQVQRVALNALVIAFVSATQDITVDAYVSDLTDRSEAGAASSMKILGYRVAMIVTGAGALIAADMVSWPAVYFVSGVVMLILAISCSRLPEPVFDNRPPASIEEAIRMPLADFFRRNGPARALCILMFMILYRLSDSMIGNMTTPFLIQSGFGQTDIGVIQGGVGLAATIAGVLAGGAIMSRIGVNRSLWLFGVLQAASNLAYLALAYIGRRYCVMAGAIIIENACYGLATAALVAFIMTLCNPKFSATQYALLSSLVAAGRDVLAAPSGSIAEAVGWPAFFLISVGAAAPGMMLLPAFAPLRLKRGISPVEPVSKELC